MPDAVDADAVIRLVKTHLASLEEGLRRVQSANPHDRLPGMFNVAVWGKAATGGLRHLRRVVGRDEFETWWAPHSLALQNDPVCSYFYGFRDDVEHRMVPELKSQVYIEHATVGEMIAAMGTPPPGAVGQFFGDFLGGSGWEVELPDGTVGKVYVALPDDLAMTVSNHMPGAMEHVPIADLCATYATAIRAVVEDAEARFGGT